MALTEKTATKDSTNNLQVKGAQGEKGLMLKSTPEDVKGLSIGQYLIKRLCDYGLQDMFGIPGDYVLNLYGLFEKSDINVVGCTREDSAGFAADAYARVHGLGAVCVTYCVGGFSVSNSIAGAFAEKSPVVVITGSPGIKERVNDPLLHHKVRDFRTQAEVFEKICVATAEIIDPSTAFRDIDRVLAMAVRYKRPVYIEIPRDMVDVQPEMICEYEHNTLKSDEQAAIESAAEAAELLAKAKKPLIIAGVEVHRFGLQDELLELAEEASIPIAATLLSKSVVRETHPLYIGMYAGSMGEEHVTKYVEDSDCILLIGTFLTDLNMGIYTAKLDASKCIYVTSEQLRIQHHHYHNVLLEDFLKNLIQKKPQPARREIPNARKIGEKQFEPEANKPITINRVIQKINQHLNEKTAVIADTGDAVFAATELCIKARTEFVSAAYYTSMGFAVPATLGCCVANPDRRVITLVGDGAFQMTGMEISTIIAKGYAPIIIVLDNRGYGTERILHPGEWEYNEINPWKYHQLPSIMGGGNGYEVRTEDEFADAFEKALKDTKNLSLIQIHIGLKDGSKTLQRLADKLGKRV